MILNVSGRTDVIAFYSEWFKKRYKEGFVDVRNPFNPTQVSRIQFKDVDAFVFCTKNPEPIIDFLPEIKQPFLFHVTLTGYLKDIEPYVPDKKRTIENIKKISKMIGPDRMYVRYDPIFISDKYTLDYHLKAFDKLCAELDGVVNHFIVSFIDLYVNVRKNERELGFHEFAEKEYKTIGEGFSASAKKHNQTVQTCFEDRNLVEYGFCGEECLSHAKAIELTGKDFPEWTARKERKCHCVQMIDIGEYNSCGHRCKYCYANFNEGLINEQMRRHNPDSTMLIGELTPHDIVTIRKDNALKGKKKASPKTDDTLTSLFNYERHS